MLLPLLLHRVPHTPHLMLTQCARRLTVHATTVRNRRHLTARNEDRLKSVKALCEGKGAEVHTYRVDVQVGSN